MYPRFPEHKSYFNYTLKPTLTEPAAVSLSYQGVSAAVVKTLWTEGRQLFNDSEILLTEQYRPQKSEV